MIPIEIINKILVYISELNNNLIITQYNSKTLKEHYKINFHSNLLFDIESSLLMKCIYPIYSCDFSNKHNIELYKFGKRHYDIQLKLNKKKIKFKLVY